MTLRTLVLVAGVLVLPWPASAQGTPTADSPWASWLGCWDLRTENLTDGEVDPVVAAARNALPSTRNGGIRICVTPTDDAKTVRHQTIVNDETVLEETMTADGRDRPFKEESCTGTRRAEWSSNRRQLFSRATLECEGQPTRTVSSLMMLVTGPTWVDVQSMEVSGNRSVRIRRYGLSRDQSFVNGRAASARDATSIVRRLTIDEVIEASKHVEPEVLQAAIVEVGNKFPLNSERLVSMDEAGVPGSVVDIMVALTFPDRFVVEKASSGGFSTAWGGGGYDPWAISSPYAYLGMFSPFAYGYYGYYDPIYGPGYGWVPVNPSPPEPDANGRVVKDRGYTRVSPRRPDPVRVNGVGVVDRSGVGGADAGSTSGSGSGSSGGSSGVSTGGYSSGSGGSGSGRTAQPRPPGGR